MRQVRLDELTHCLFSGMGSWSHNQRRTLAAGNWGTPGDWLTLKGHAEAILRKLYGCEFYDDPSGDPLTPAALAELLAGFLQAWPKTLRAGFVASVQRDRDWAKYHAAHWLADQLAGLTILRDSPEPPFFRWANFEGGSGPMAESAEEADRRSYGRSVGQP